MSGTMISFVISATTADSQHWVKPDREAADDYGDESGWVMRELRRVAVEACLEWADEHPSVFSVEPM